MTENNLAKKYDNFLLLLLACSGVLTLMVIGILGLVCALSDEQYVLAIIIFLATILFEMWLYFNFEE